MIEWGLQGMRQSATIGTGKGYTVGMALNPKRQDELIVCAGDKPPGDALPCSGTIVMPMHALLMLCLSASQFARTRSSFMSLSCTI